ncbi:MAG: hypothetical protein GC180_08300 [Bacteroidetes bacterium]|nr:hypothetical protein [Bacteroidota bacterium]
MTSKYKLQYLLLTLICSAAGLNAQTYSGIGVQVLDSLMHDSILFQQVEMDLMLDAWTDGGETEKKKLHYLRFGNDWTMRNDDFLMIGNKRYVLVVSDIDSVAFLTDEGKNKQEHSLIFKDSASLDSAIFYSTQGSKVSFLIRSDSNRQTVVYTVDTLQRVLKSVEISTHTEDGKAVNKQVIHYINVQSLIGSSTFPKMDEFVEIHRKKAKLIGKYSNYLFYDNRIEP